MFPQVQRRIQGDTTVAVATVRFRNNRLKFQFIKALFVTS